MINLVLIDDHELFRLGIKELLNKQNEFNVIGELSSFKEAMKKLPKMDFQMALIDINLDDNNGIELLKWIKREFPKTKCAFLSMHKEEFYLIKAIESNTDGYLHKNIRPDELLLGLKKIIKGEKYFSNEISNILINKMVASSKVSSTFVLPQLTNRESEILKYLVDGYSSKKIAKAINLSHRTVDSHRANILRKFGFRNTTELVKTVLENKIL